MSADEYWKSFYETFDVREPSRFAVYVAEWLDSNVKASCKILDAGCGNGRDAQQFASQPLGHIVTAIDRANMPADARHCHFLLGDMISLNKRAFNVIYMRFTFHAITDSHQEAMLDSVEPGSQLCIEARSARGIHTRSTEYCYGANHYRNLVDSDRLVSLLSLQNQDILVHEEGSGFAPFAAGDRFEDPLCIRVIARRGAF